MRVWKGVLKAHTPDTQTQREIITNLEDVVLDRARQRRRGHAALLGRHDKHREHGQHGAVHRHGHAHFVERDAVKEHLFLMMMMMMMMIVLFLVKRRRASRREEAAAGRRRD